MDFPVTILRPNCPAIFAGGGGGGGDPFFANVVLLALQENGGNGSTTFIDQSVSAKTLTAVNGAQWSTAQFPTGLTSSGLFAAAGNDRITTPNSSDFNFGSGDFTVELWARLNTASFECLINQGTATDHGWSIYNTTGTIAFNVSSNGTTDDIAGFDTMGAISNNVWTHIALSKASGTYRCYVGGVKGVDLVNATAIFNATGILTIARGNGDPLSGNIGGIRITKGVARYTGASLTPPTLPMPTS